MKNTFSSSRLFSLFLALINELGLASICWLLRLLDFNLVKSKHLFQKSIIDFIKEFSWMKKKSHAYPCFVFRRCRQSNKLRLKIRKELNERRRWEQDHST